MIDDGSSFVRVQCKTGRLRKGAITFPTCSSTYHHPKNKGVADCHQGYTGQAELFGVYCPETDDVYLVPVGEVGSRAGSLRVAPAKNNQIKKVRWARDFLSCALPG